MQTGSYVTKISLNRTSLWKNSGPFLGRLDMELTERCNNDCAHCYINLPADDPDAKEKEVSTEGIKRILKEAVSLGCLRVRFTGGEPLLREDFEELYVFARRIGLKVLVFTNATLIDEPMADLFARIPPLEKIEVTFYGVTKSSYEAVSRTAGSFEAARRGIDLLVTKKIPFVIKGVLLPANKGEIDEFDAWAAGIPGMDEPPTYSMFLDLRCRRDGRKNKLIKKLRLTPEEGLRVLSHRKDKYVKEMEEFCSKFMRPPSEKLFSCGAGVGCGCVDAYGNFQLCMALRHPDTVYSLKNGSLKDALFNFFPKVRGMKAVDPRYLARCAKCFLKGLCEQCPAKSWTEHGTLDTPVEYLCQIAHAQARSLGLVREGERAWEVSRGQKRVSKFVRSQEV